MTALHLIQFSDPHLFAGEHESLRGIATLPSLTATLAHAQSAASVQSVPSVQPAQPTAWPPDALLVTGDIVQHDPAGYRHFRTLLAPAPVPVLCLPGNHDDPEAMRRELASPPFILGGHVDMKGWRIVLLDSRVAGAAHGELAGSQLQLLTQALATADARHCVVCLHHHPVPMGSRWLDTVGLRNAAAFWEVIDRHPRVRAVLWGHVHQAYDGERRGVRLLATPSTGAQFLPGSDTFQIDSRPPGYRTLTLEADGTVRTEVVWLEGRASAPPLSPGPGIPAPPRQR